MYRNNMKKKRLQFQASYYSILTSTCFCCPPSLHLGTKKKVKGSVPRKPYTAGGEGDKE